MTKLLIPALCLVVLVQGCATMQEPIRGPGPDSGIVHSGFPSSRGELPPQPPPTSLLDPPASSAPLIKVTPLMLLQDNSGSCTGGCQASYAGKYTRLVLVGDLPGTVNGSTGIQPGEIAPYVKRDALSRFVLSKASGISLVAHITIPATLKSVVPLVSLSRLSNSDGEAWSRELVLEKKATPFFLVKDDGSNSSVSVLFEAKASDTFASRGLAVGVSALNKLAATAGVNPPLITSLNKDSVRNLATELDSAISRLLATSITEKIEADRSLRAWGAEKGKGISLSFRVPKGLEGTDMQEANLRTVGTWHAYFETPRPSIFVDMTACDSSISLDCLAADDVEASVARAANLASVLSYPVGGSGDVQRTIKSHMRQTDWWAASTRDWAVATAAGARTTSITAFCKQVVSEAAELGFSGVDAKLILAAIIELVPLPSETAEVRSACASTSLRVPQQRAAS